MNAEETKQAAAVMIASETKNIQERYRHGKSDDGWVDCPEPDWDWDSFEFRIAPEPLDFERATNALKHIRDIVAEKDANGEDIEIGSTAMKSILRWASGELKEPRQPEPLEVEVWVGRHSECNASAEWPTCLHACANLPRSKRPTCPESRATL